MDSGRAIIRPDDCCILNSGGGAWAFAALARQLSAALWLDVSEMPRRYNYLLACDNLDPAMAGEFFVPLRGIELAADKRLLAEVFAAYRVPTPETHLVPTLQAAEQIRRDNPDREWCLKYPTSSGASGHRLLTPGLTLPREWPHPLIVQEFIRLEHLEVYRLYAAGSAVFGCVARRFPAGKPSSPWVAHAHGARYELAGTAPAPAVAASRAALEAAGLLDSFGCADLVQRPSGAWLVLEVGTDGMYNHVDRDLGCPELECEIEQRVAEAFWGRAGWRPWGERAWRRRPGSE